MAGDGVFTTTINVRSTLTQGEMSFLVRASDIFQSMTPEGEQIHSLELIDEKGSGINGGSWFVDNTNSIVLVALLILLALGATAAILMVRNADLE